MRVTRIETFPVEPRWLFVKVETDEGIVGWGEGLGDKALVTAAAVQSYAHHLLGEDPGKIVHHWQAMFRGAFWRGGPTLCAALSALEMALWDIKGKRLDVPVYSLLGGPTRERIRLYAHIGGRTPDELAGAARSAMERGFTAVKFSPFGKVQLVEGARTVDDAVMRLAAVRQAVGREVDIMLDFHGRVSPAMAVRVEEGMRAYQPLFIEEPVLPENADALAMVVRQFKTPVATGERLFTKWGFREVVEAGVAVLQPDPCICGGILETVHIAAMGECWYSAVAPHNPYGPINLAAALQIDAAIPNFLIQEQVHLGEGYLKTPFTMRDGWLDVPQGAGLGIEVDEEYVRSRPLGEKSDPGIWRHDDGSVCDW